MNVKYKIEQVKPNIFAVIIKDNYDRAMTFCRVQEYYESPNKKFKGKKFSIWEYMKWYSKNTTLGFTYPYDWEGFNIPFDVLHRCYTVMNEHETPYDKVMCDIYENILKDKSEGKAFILGIGKKNDTFKHELCHALWHTNKAYRKEAKSILDAIDETHIKIFKTNLLNMGYVKTVLEDEIQAYLTTFWRIDRFYIGIIPDDCEIYHREFNKCLKPFF